MVRGVALTIENERLLDLIDPDYRPERVSGGHAFTEGPAWHALEQHLTFSDVRRPDTVSLDGVRRRGRFPRPFEQRKRQHIGVWSLSDGSRPGRRNFASACTTLVKAPDLVQRRKYQGGGS